MSKKNGDRAHRIGERERATSEGQREREGESEGEKREGEIERGRGGKGREKKRFNFFFLVRKIPFLPLMKQGFYNFNKESYILKLYK